MELKPFERKLYLSSPTMHGDELRYMTEAFETNWMSTLGENLNVLEKTISEMLGCKDVVALSCGTAAIHLCLKLAGLKPGEKVFCSDMTFSATVNPVVYEGGVPIFIDSERTTWNMDPKALERAFDLYPDVRLVIVANLYGTPAKLTEIAAVCKKHNAILIEDAAESFGATYDGKMAGTFGEYNAISFNGNKIMTTGAGGFVVSNHADWAEHAKHLSTQAKADMLQFLHDEVGYNYRMTNVQACLGLAQLERLEGFVETKKARYDQYKAALDGVHGLRILPFKEESDGVRSNHWFYSLYLKDSGLDRDTVIAKLQEQGIQTRPVWALINEQADYPKNEAYALEKAQDYRKYIVNLPCSTNLTEQDCERVIAAVKNL